MTTHTRLSGVTIQRRWKIYHFSGYVDRTEVNAMLDWCESLPNQCQYESVIDFHVISDCPPGPPCYQFRTNLYGKEVAGPFFKRWVQ